MLHPVEDNPRQPHPLTPDERARLVHALKAYDIWPCHIPGDRKPVKPKRSTALQPWQARPSRRAA